MFIHSRERVSLPDALAEFAKTGGEAVGLLYSPRSCDFATMSEGQPKGSDGRPVDLSAVYEARVFSKDAELRWLNDPTQEQRHRAVILTEQDRPSEEGAGKERSRCLSSRCSTRTYLLWGMGTEAKPYGRRVEPAGHCRVSAALAVPIGGAARNNPRQLCVLLHTLEYLTESEYGNVVVADERLCRLEVVNGSNGKLVVNAKNQIRVRFTNAKNVEVVMAVSDAELSAALRAVPLKELNGRDVELDVEKGQPRKVRPVGETFAAPRPQPPAGGQRREQQGSRRPQGGGRLEPQGQKRPANQSPGPRPAFHNPYNFVPAPSRVVDHPELGDHEPAGHHRYHADRVSGVIRVTMTLKTPLLLPDAGLVIEGANDHKTFPGCGWTRTAGRSWLRPGSRGCCGRPTRR